MMLNHPNTASRIGSQSKWLDVQTNQKLAQTTQPQLLTLCDLRNDAYFKLVLAEVPADETSTKSKLKVFKGIGMVSEHSLPGIPTALVSFYTDEHTSKTPIIAVSIGPSVLFYRNMKPYFKFTIPSLPINTVETDVWRKLPIQVPDGQGALVDQLRTIPMGELSPLSQKLLRLDPAEWDNFIKENAETKIERLVDITAMTTLHRHTSDTRPPSCLVLATKIGGIFVVDPQLFKIVHQARVFSSNVAPSLISASGLLDTDFLIVASTREGYVYILRKSWPEGREILETENPIIHLTLLPVDQTIVVATEDREVACYSKKGKKLWEIELDTNAKCIVPVPLAHLGLTLIAVALTNQKVQIYSQTALVDEIKVKDNICAMIFGRLGQEDHVLSLVTIRGDLLVKILKRTAEFKDEIKPAPDSQRKKGKQRRASKLVVHKIKDKEKAIAILNSNPAELLNFRLTVARATMDAINSAEGLMTTGDERMKLAAEVCGVGPEFRMFLALENLSSEKEIPNLRVLLHANPEHYTLPKQVAKLTILEPSMVMEIDFEVIAVLDPETYLPPPTLTEENSIVRVFIFRNDDEKPLIAAVVPMPASEAPLEI